jgi:hypothetical protein
VAYVGNQPARGQWRKLSDISSGFDGVITTFTTSVPPGTSEYFVTAGSASQLLISLGGVIQQPEVDYTVSTNSITFTTPPTGGLSFFGVLCGDALNVGAPADGSVTSAKLAGGLSVGLTGGSASTPSLFFTGDANTGLFSPTADTIAFAEGGSEAMRIDSSGRLLVGTTTATANGGVLELSGGITFPATAVAATDPNTLDDYEEGTFTPGIANNLSFPSPGGSAVYEGSYTKIGNVVYVTISLNFNASGTNMAVGNAIEMNGLPFSSSVLPLGQGVGSTIPTFGTANRAFHSVQFRTGVNFGVVITALQGTVNFGNTLVLSFFYLTTS